MALALASLNILMSFHFFKICANTETLNFKNKSGIMQNDSDFVSLSAIKSDLWWIKLLKSLLSLECVFLAYNFTLLEFY